MVNETMFASFFFCTHRNTNIKYKYSSPRRHSSRHLSPLRPVKSVAQYKNRTQIITF
jgi:hypothetical protein